MGDHSFIGFIFCPRCYHMHSPADNSIWIDDKEAVCANPACRIAFRVEMQEVVTRQETMLTFDPTKSPMNERQYVWINSTSYGLIFPTQQIDVEI